MISIPDHMGLKASFRSTCTQVPGTYLQVQVGQDETRLLADTIAEEARAHLVVLIRTLSPLSALLSIQKHVLCITATDIQYTPTPVFSFPSPILVTYRACFSWV